MEASGGNGVLKGSVALESDGVVGGVVIEGNVGPSRSVEYLLFWLSFV